MPIGSFFVSPHLAHAFFHHDAAFLVPERNGIFADFLHAEAAKDGKVVLSLELLHRDAAFLVPERNGVFADFLHAEAAKDGGVVFFLDLLHARFARRVQLVFVLYVLHFHDEADLPVLPPRDDVAAAFAGFDVGRHVPVRAGA